MITHSAGTYPDVFGLGCGSYWIQHENGLLQKKDLKQFVWSISVSSDHAFPLFQHAYSGNTADVTTYVEQWQQLIDPIGRTAS